MNKFLAFISAAFAMLAFLSVVLMSYAAHNNGGMTVLLFQVWALIAGGAAIVFGLISWLLTKRTDQPTPGGARFGFGFGLGSLLALAIIVFIFG